MPTALKVMINVIVISFPVAMIAFGVIGVRHLLERHEDPGKRARILKRAGIGVMGGLALFFGAFAIGETFSDPGGWKALGMVSSWLAPLVAVAALAWYRPAWAQPLLAVLAAGAIGLVAWAQFWPEIRELEDRVGPFSTVILMAVAVAVAPLAHTRPRAAALLLLATGVIPIAVALLATVEKGPGFVLYLITGVPMVVSAVLFLTADRILREGVSPPEPRSGSLGQPRTA